MSRLGSRFLLVLLSLLLPLIAWGQTASPSRSTSPRRGVIHWGIAGQPARQAQANTTASSNPHFDYFGGAVISNIQVVVVYWGKNVSSEVTTKIPGFYSAVAGSSYLDMLSEYSTKGVQGGGATGKQKIGRGSVVGEFTITPSVTATTVDDSEIQNELLAQIQAGHLPAPTTDATGNINTWYAIYFPPGVTITMGTQSSCQSGGFCGYHGTVQSADNRLLTYGVIPDFGPASGCSVGCGADSEFDNLTAVSGHEMAESVTDPGVGLAFSDAPPLAWYDAANNDEVADACGSRSDLKAGGSTFKVQDVWSNLQGACVSLPARFDVSAPSTATAAAPLSLTVTIKNSGGSTLPNYRGTIHFTSSDANAVLPPDYTFTSGDNGAHKFSATLQSPGTQTVSVADVLAGGFTGHATITVSSAAATHLAINAPAAVDVGGSLSFSVTALDDSGNVDTSFADTVHFSSTDTAASLPADAKLTNGAGTFTATLRTGGAQTLTVTDTANSAVHASATVTVNVPNLQLTKTHVGNFLQGQSGAAYSLVVSNTGGAATNGVVTVVDTLPAGLTATAVGGTGWSCVLNTLTCTRSDALAAASAYAPITVTVNVAANAPQQLTNTAAVSGGGEQNTSDDSASDTATIAAAMPDLAVALTRVGGFIEGVAGSGYTVIASNAGQSATAGVVTVTANIGGGLTTTAISGSGWTCAVGTPTCTRSDSLAAGASYPPITVALTVTSAASITSSVTVSGGGEANAANDSASDVVSTTPAIVLAAGNAAVTVAVGQQVQVPLTLTDNAGVPVTFSCSGLPANAGCSFNPATAQASATVTMTIATETTSARGQTVPAVWAMLTLPAFGLFLLPAAGSKKRWWLIAVAAVVLLLLLAGCGGNASPAPPTSSKSTTLLAPQGTYNVVVTGQGGGFQGQTTISLTIQ